MTAQLRTSESESRRTFKWRTQSSRIFIGLLSMLLIAAVACGTDRGGDGVAAGSFQVEDESVTWSPPWEEGDARSVHIESSIEFSEAINAFIDDIEPLYGVNSDAQGQRSTTTGTVSIVSVGSTGSTGQFDVDLAEVLRQLNGESTDQFGADEADIQFDAMASLFRNLDLGVEFDIGTDGGVFGVSNLEELAETVRELFDSLRRFAALAGDDDVSSDDMEMIERALDELPDTQIAQTAADTGINLALANMFLMRAGEFELGETVVATGLTQTMFGMNTQGVMRYTLTDISDDTLTVEVEVEPGEVDLTEVLDSALEELAPIFGDEIYDDIGDPSEGSERELAQGDALFGVLLQPYTVTLTLDAETGWVTAADWSVELRLPEGFEDLAANEHGEVENLNGFELEDFAITVNTRATFEEPVDNE